MTELEHTDALAAEYVLGTLDADERAQARALLTVDAAFVLKVQFWERQLGELHLMVEPVEPDPELWTRIKTKMVEMQSKPPPPRLPEPQNLEPPPAAAVEPAAPDAPLSLDAIEAAISQAATALNAEAAEASAEPLSAEQPRPDAIDVATSQAPTTLNVEAAEPPPAQESLAEPRHEPPIVEVIDAAISETASASTDNAVEPAAEVVGSAPPADRAVPPAEEPAPLPSDAVPAAPAQWALEPDEPMPALAPDVISSADERAGAMSDTAALKAEAPAEEAAPAAIAAEAAVAAPFAPVLSAPASAPVVSVEEKWTPAAEPQPAVIAARRAMRRWRALALVLLLLVAALAALLAAWRFAPERVPPALRPLELLRQMGVPIPAPQAPPRRPLPPQFQFDE
jgi:hypothetical protein